MAYTAPLILLIFDQEVQGVMIPSTIFCPCAELVITSSTIQAGIILVSVILRFELSC